MRGSAPGDSERWEEDWVEHLAAELVERGLETPACVALELLRPLSFVASQLLLAVDPLLGDQLGQQSRPWRRLLEDRRAFDALLARLAASRHRPNVSGEEP